MELNQSSADAEDLLLPVVEAVVTTLLLLFAAVVPESAFVVEEVTTTGLDTADFEAESRATAIKVAD